tara:strand:+ start:295 stop:498 length:204 start_codon:yes stop_codon:yes gene_type:complete
MKTTKTKQKTVFEKAQEMTLPQSIQVLTETANVAQKAGLLSVEDSVLVARAIEVVGQGLMPKASEKA